MDAKQEGDSLAAYKAQRIERDRQRLVAMTDAGRRALALDIAQKAMHAERMHMERKAAAAIAEWRAA